MSSQIEFKEPHFENSNSNLLVDYFQKLKIKREEILELKEVFAFSLLSKKFCSQFYKSIKG